MADQTEKIREQVRQGYAQIARKGVFTLASDSAVGGCSPGGGCCGPTNFDVGELVKSIGYSDSELASAPPTANMGLSCGNPTALASLANGEVVLDLGCGGGFDVFIAGPKVGPAGRVIGVDMTADMLAKARAGIPTYTQHTGLSNVEFRLGEIEHLPVADGSVDVVISNCVINLSPDKEQVWREIARVPRPGGRIAISDLALLQPLPPNVSTMVEALIGCIAGAMCISEITEFAQLVGLSDLQLTKKTAYIETLANWDDPLYEKLLAALPTGSSLGDYVTSLDISACKPM